MRCPASLLAIALLSAGCTASVANRSGETGSATVSLNGATFAVRSVELSIQTGESAWFRIAGEPADRPDQDCVPGLGGGLALYGDLPASVRHPSDLVGKRLRVDFSGDGDDANFCFIGMGGLAGAEDAWVTIDSVNGRQVSFTMSGSFKIYDENGDGPIAPASAKGTAVAREES